MVVLVGSKQNIFRMVKNKSTLTRNTLLKNFLIESADEESLKQNNKLLMKLMKVLITQKAMLRWIKLESKLTSVFYPSGYKCLICGCEIDGGNFEFCKKCFKTLPTIYGKTCVKCGEPIFSDSELCLFCKKEMPSFTKCFAPYTFSPPITNLIYRLKYNGEKFVAKTLSNLLLKFFMEQNVDVDIVIPVPLHLKREAQRKFNQSELLAQSFKEHGFNVDVTCVVRIKTQSLKQHFPNNLESKTWKKLLRC